MYRITFTLTFDRHSRSFEFSANMPTIAFGCACVSNSWGDLFPVPQWVEKLIWVQAVWHKHKATSTRTRILEDIFICENIKYMEYM